MSAETHRLSSDEYAHYSRQLSLPEIGPEGQRKLKNARVLVIGAGGLGVPMLQYLAAAGVGTIGIVDFDTVETSNLHRQVLYKTNDVGRPKVEAARDHLKSLNPFVTFQIYPERLSSDNALTLFTEYDIIADGTDNFPTRYLINDASVMLDKPFVQASIFQFTGQLSVFNYLGKNEEPGPNYRDLFPEPPPPGSVPSCAEAGVLGVLPGIIGTLQANEIIKLITNIGDSLSGQLFLFDAKKFTSRKISIAKDPGNPLRGNNPELTELIDYNKFCGVPSEEASLYPKTVPEVSIGTYQSWLEEGEQIELVDVREPFEAESMEMGGKLIPLKNLREEVHNISNTGKVVLHCHSGKRSAKAVRVLQEEFGFDNVYSLKGGIQAWAEETENSEEN